MRIATDKVKTRQCTINNAEEFFEAVKGSHIATILITSEQLQERVDSLQLQDIFANARQIRGTAEQHWVAMNTRGELITERYSSESADTCMLDEESHSASENLPSEADSTVLGHWYAVYWKASDYWFIGRVPAMESEEEVRMEFIHQTAADVNNFKITNDIDIVPVKDILVKVGAQCLYHLQGVPQLN